MTRILLNDLTPGLVLAEPVKNGNGTVLIPQGVELTEKHIRAMKMWGILDISIVSPEGNAGSSRLEQIPPEKLEAAKSAVRDRFSLANIGHPFISELFNQTAVRHARNSQ